MSLITAFNEAGSPPETDLPGIYLLAVPNLPARLCGICLDGVLERAAASQTGETRSDTLVAAQNQTGSVVWISRTGQAGALSRLPELLALPTRHFVRLRALTFGNCGLCLRTPKSSLPAKSRRVKNRTGSQPRETDRKSILADGRRFLVLFHRRPPHDRKLRSASRKATDGALVAGSE